MVFAPGVVEVSEQLPTLTVAVQFAAPSLTVTFSVPGMLPLPGPLTPTVKATVYDCPATVAVDRSEVIVVIVPALFTACDSAGEVLPT